MMIETGIARDFKLRSCPQGSASLLGDPNGFYDSVPVAEEVKWDARERGRCNSYQGHEMDIVLAL
jgi:hypothetical protein